MKKREDLMKKKRGFNEEKGPWWIFRKFYTDLRYLPKLLIKSFWSISIL